MFPDFLVSLYHSMHTAAAVMEDARDRSVALAPDCAVAAALVPYWRDHLREEAGHDEWLLADLAHLGVDARHVRGTRPDLAVAELMGTLHFWIRHTHPVAALAYFYVVETDPPRVDLLEWLAEQCGIPRDGLRTFYRHASIDVAHGRELVQLIDALPLTDAHLELLATSAATVIRQLTAIYDALTARADAMRGND